jgi:hypothetical protein
LDNLKKEFESRFSFTQGTIEIKEEPEYFIITHRETYFSEGIASEISVCGAAMGNFLNTQMVNRTPTSYR